LSFSSFDLHPKILEALTASNFETPTEVQKQTIPPSLEGRDIMASAQTGTGKTAAFALPAIQRLLTPSTKSGRGPRAIILTPTRELAKQVTQATRQIGRFTRINFATIVGGVPYAPQERILARPSDILVATPGRLIDHMNQGRVDFSRLELFILDEADRMLDMGFINDVERIAAEAPKDKQTLLFSATLEGAIEKIAKKILNNPVRVAVASVKDNHSSIMQHIHQADDIQHKRALLTHLLEDPQLTQAIIFTATKKSADRLALSLANQGHRCAALHGDMKQGNRNRTVEQLRRKKIQLLVATDVAARGLDIKGISHVINFDLPMAAEDYIHRIGRTGRGGATGVAMSLIGPEDWIKLSRIERLTGSKLERKTIEGLEPSKPIPKTNGFAKKRNNNFSKNGRRFSNPRNSTARPYGNTSSKRFQRSRAES